MRIGLFAYGPGIGLEAGLDDVLTRMAKAEVDGFHTIWSASANQADAIIMLSLAGRLTRKVELGTAVVPTYPRHPVALASQVLTAQAASDNRFTLGIGLSHKRAIEDSLGLDYSKPIRHMREYLTVLTGLLSGQRVEFKGEEYRVAAQVRVPKANRPQVLVAALGPQMLKLAGTLADGTITWMGGPKYLEETAIPTLTKAAQEAGRPAPRVVAGFPVAVTKNPEAAKTSAAHIFAGYGKMPSYRAILDIEGVQDPTGACIIGDEAEVRRQLKRLADIGITDVNATPYSVRDDPGAMERTYQFLADMAKAGV